jgi:tetratricopeptide (TPR) repeat protein
VPKDSRNRPRGGRRSRSDDRPRHNGDSNRPRKPWSPDGGQLPNWVAEQLARVTPKAKLRAATDHLLQAASYFAGAKYGKALEEARQAKELSPRDATIREILALSAYRLGQWDLALRELRTFRRFTGEATHMPVEMDVLRALGRPDDVRDVWKQFSKMDQGMRETRNEGKVVYGSFLLDEGDARRAWDVTNPKRMSHKPEESELRVWYVASRAAAALGDTKTARQIFEAIEAADTAFPGLEDLGREIRND